MNLSGAEQLAEEGTSSKRVCSSSASQNCPFCAYAAARVTPEPVVFEDEDVFVFPSRQQKRGNQGHCLVVSRIHVPDLLAPPNRLAAPMLRAVSLAARASKAAFGAAVSVRQNNGAASGQDVFHVRFHVIPRFDSDDFESARYEVVDEAVRIQQADTLRRAWPSALEPPVLA